MNKSDCGNVIFRDESQFAVNTNDKLERTWKEEGGRTSRIPR